MALRTSLPTDEIAFGGGFAMAIVSYLDDVDPDPETKRVLRVALKLTRAALGLATDFANGIIAKQIVEFARAGERHPDVLCEGALSNYAGICSETNGGTSKRPPLRRSPST